jgi:hypothetical protein
VALSCCGVRAMASRSSSFLSLWESMDAVRRFAGDDPARAVFHDEDDGFLVERDLHVDHFEVVIDEVTDTARSPCR